MIGPFSTVVVEPPSEPFVKRRYSVTADVVAYRRCARQYGAFRVHSYAPAHQTQLYFGTIVHQVLDHAGFERVKVGGQSLRYLVFHSLRHTFASHWVMNGGDLFKLQRIGGWRSQAMVQRYAHLAPDAFIEDYALFQSPTAEGELIRLNPKPSHQRRNR